MMMMKSTQALLFRCVMLLQIIMEIQSFVVSPTTTAYSYTTRETCQFNNDKHNHQYHRYQQQQQQHTKLTKLNLKDENLTEEERAIKVEKAMKAMTAFSNKYISNSETTYCKDLSIPAVVIKGLAEHKVSLGTPLCPCRYYEDKEKEAKDGFWNCPCVPMRERNDCHCMLFLTEDNSFAGDRTEMTVEEVKKLSSGMGG